MTVFAAIPECVVGMLPSHQDCRPILSGDGDHFGLMRGAFQPIADGSDEQIVGGRPAPFAVHLMRSRVLDAVDRLPGHRIHPLIFEDAARLWVGPGAEGGMSQTCNARGIIEISVGKECPFSIKTLQSPGKVRRESLEIVLAHLIDGDKYDQSRRFVSVQGE